MNIFMHKEIVGWLKNTLIYQYDQLVGVVETDDCVNSYFLELF